MSLFNALKSYEHEINEIRRFLEREKNMRKEFSDPFVTAYGRKIGALVQKGRKRALSFNTSTQMGAEANRAFAETSVRFAVLNQAIYAYLRDLRSGKYVNTAVETAIWAVILDEDPDLVDRVKPGLFDFLVENFEEKVPSVVDVFEYDEPEPELENKGNKKSESKEKKRYNVTIKPSGKSQEKVLEALVYLMGEEDANEALDLLSRNDLVAKSLGQTVSSMSVSSRLSIALGWLTNVVEDKSIWRGVLSNRPIDDSKEAVGSEKYFSTSQVTSLIANVEAQLDRDDDLNSKTVGSHFKHPDSSYKSVEIDRSTRGKKMDAGLDKSMQYMEHLSGHLKSILSHALLIKDPVYAELLSEAIWSSHARACAVRAGLQLGLKPRDAAVLTASIVGQTFEHVHGKAPMTGETKRIYEYHLEVARSLNSDLERFKFTSVSTEFLKLFMEDFDIKTLF